MKQILIFLPIGFAPGLFWLWYFYRKDRYEPEPRKLILKTAFLGGVAGVCAALLELPLSGAGIVSMILVAPIVEEICKYASVRWTVYNDPEFDEPMDGLIYAAAAALGFASFENAGYVLVAFHKGGGDAAFGTFWGRAILSVPGHVLFSSIWGSALGNAKFSSPERRPGMVAKGLILAIVCHAGWNLLCSIRTTPGLLLCAFVVLLWSVLNRNVRALLRRSPYRPAADGGGIDPNQVTTRSGTSEDRAR
jgi:protease PrsW